MNSTVEQFAEWLERRAGRLKPGTPLGTASEMATRWGISVRSVERALIPFRDNGRIVRVRKRGTFVGPMNVVNDVPATVRRSSAQRIADSIRESISTGLLKVGDTLPLVKNTTSRYRVTSGTAVKAYKILIKQGLVEKSGKCFVVGRSSDALITGARETVWLFTESGHASERLFTGEHYAIPYRRFENELRLHGCRLELERTELLENRIREWIGRRKPPYGIAVAGLTRNSTELVESALRKLLAAFPRARIPLLLDSHFSHRYTLKGDVAVVSRPRVWRFMTQSLCTMVVQSGMRSAVLWDLFDDPKGLPGMFTEEMRGVYEPFRFVHENFSFKPMARAEFRMFLEHSDVVPRHAIEFLKRQGFPRLESWEQAAIAHAAVFDRRLESRDSPLWICTSDMAAATVLFWARMKGVVTPRDIAVIGFDNDPRFYHLAISTMSPEWERLGYLMAHAVVGDFMVAKDVHKFLRFSGRFIPRDTAYF